MSFTPVTFYLHTASLKIFLGKHYFFLIEAVIVFSILFSSSAGFAQTDSTRTTGNTGDSPVIALPDTSYRTAFTSMSRSVNLFLWNINSGISGATSGGKYFLNERMTASEIPETGEQSVQRTDADVKLGLGYPVANNFLITGTSAVQSLVDNQNIGINNVTRFGAMAGVDARPLENLRMIGEAGSIFDKQIGVSNTGAQYAADVQLTPLNLNEYILSGDAASAQEFLSPRRNSTENASVNAVMQTPTAELRTHFDLRHTERDFYFPDSASTQYTGQAFNIEQRKEDGVHGGLQGDYIASDVWRLRFDGDVSDQTITHHDAYKSYDLPASHIDTRIDELRLAGGASVFGELFGASVNAFMRYEDYEETHGVVAAPENSTFALQQQAAVESQKNSIQKHTQLGGALGIPVSHADTLVLSTTMGIMRYDTPDTNNTDDRDELDLAYHASYSTRLLPGCTWGLRGDIFMHHLVYLFAAQSGNNTWNRIIRLNPFITINPGRGFRSFGSFEVLGNYTVYDFESVLQSVHSYSFRQIELRDSSEYDLNARFRIVGNIDVRLYEHGQLDYAAFSERPIDRVQEWTYAAALQEFVTPQFRVSAGGRVFTRFADTYGGGGVYVPSNSLRAFGPAVNIFWIAERYGILGLDCWYELLYDGAEALQIVPNVTMNVKWNL